MSFSIEARPIDRVVIATLNKDFDPQKDLEGYVQELKKHLDQLPEPHALITVVSEIPAGFGDIVAGLGFLTKGKMAVLGHPNINEIIVVTTNDLFSLGARALGQAQYGSLRVSVARTLEEAIEHVQQEQASG